MKKGVIIGLVIGVVLILVIVFFVLTSNKGNSQDENADVNKMVDCGTLDNPGCFLNRMNECLPVTGWFMSGENKVEMTILGVENNTCHFQRKINNVLNMNCYFPEGTMSSDILSQTLGEDKGLQSVVDEACK